MSRSTRAAASFVLTLATVTLPLLLSHCAAACEAHQNAAATPSCHHHASTITTFDHLPSSCVHDHASSVLGQVSPSMALHRMFDGAMAAAVVTPLVDKARLDRPTDSHAPPGSALTLQAQSLPLRI